MRDYDPTTGRYLQADPLGLIDGASVYNDARQSPLRYSDPTGECPVCLLVTVAALSMPLDYLEDDCYTWQDFPYSLASNISPWKKFRWAMRAAGGGGGGGGGAAGGGGGPSPHRFGPPESTPTPLHVTKDGVVIPNDGKHIIPPEYVQNPNRNGSYGEYVDGKFVERLRVDPATPTGTPGPEYSHYHIDGSKTHYGPNSPNGDPGFGSER